MKKGEIMNNYFVSYDKKDCNGCGVCELKCPKKCITMTEDFEGFLYPIIDKKSCINCKVCEKVCANFNDGDSSKAKTYIAINKNEEERYNSASGGMYYPIAKYVLNNNGVVFGVRYNENLLAIHDYAETLEDAKKFQGSKYMRSDLNNSYKRVEEFLKEGRYVLFTGTPCQCKGLKVYLKDDYQKLITCEIVCHANPSPKLFKNYVKSLEKIKGKEVVNVLFRSKENGWRNQTPIIVFNDGSKEEENSYFKAFVTELINRPSCYDCRFCTEKRCSDFSIADFWGIEKIDINYDDGKGTSLLNVNTKKGHYIFEKIFSEFNIKEVDTKLAFSYNHHKNVPMHRNRNKMFKKINDDNLIYYMNKYTKTPITTKLIRKSKKIIKKIIKY